MEHTCNFFGSFYLRSYLSIKRVALQLIDTLELMSIALCHDQTILPSLEEFRLIKYLVSTSGEVPFPVDVDTGAPFPIFTKSGLSLIHI